MAALTEQTHDSATRTPRWALWAGVLWVCAIVAGFALLLDYKETPGTAAHAPRSWPAASTLAHTAGRPTLVMLAHPGCVCSRASVSELAAIMAEASERVTAYVLVVREEGLEDDALRLRASEIDGVHALADEGGREAALFGARTSGQTVVYDGTGRLVFSGGITSERGHEGDNLGRRRVLAAIFRGAPDHASSPVYGCALPLGAEQDTR